MTYIQTLSLILSQSSLSLVAQYIGLCPNTIIHGYLARFSGLLASCNYIRNDIQVAQGRIGQFRLHGVRGVFMLQMSVLLL